MQARGFSLIEAMIVVAIAGIVAAMTLPRISSGVRRERSRAEAVKVADTITRARNRARVQVCRVQVTIGAASVALGPDPADPTVACRTMPSETVALDAKLVTLSPFQIGGTATNPLVFNGDGGVAAASRARMAIALADASPRVIEVWPAIGTVRMLP